MAGETPSSNHCPKSSFVPQSVKMREGLEGPEAPQSSIHVSSAVLERERSKAPKSCLSEGTQTQTQQQPNRAFEDTLNVNEASNQEIPPMITPGFELVYNGKGTEAPSNLLGKELTMH
ncbi:hypothetical protein SETIT_8G150200v2 [Setaria italica]|uniref:Uncharacterized protein n=1 Tax=Setaria italica TaxID=4555 RepID=A0A368S7Z4_SETIT|nr:hypothetical protein SETIT_8G150200v2 [Setaria italica]